MTSFILGILKALLKLRYQVTLHNADLLDGISNAIFLPNHQALVDPQLLITHIYKQTKAVPAVTESFYNLPILHSIFKSWGAVKVADLQLGSRQVDVLETVTGQLTEALDSGKNVVIYPAGQISDGALESIKNKQTAHSLVINASKNTSVIGVRISGLWGSTWSKYYTGSSPAFIPVLLKSALWCLANFIFLMPRRKVSISFYDIKAEAQKEALKDRKSFNKYLEGFYNKELPNKASLIPLHFLQPKPKENVSDDVEIKLEISDNEIKEETLSIVIRSIQKELGTEQPVRLSDHLENDLGLDSLGVVNIIEEIESGLNQPFPQNLSEITTVKHLCILAMGNNEVSFTYKACDFDGFEKRKGDISIHENSTILNEALKTLQNNPKEPLFWDNTLGTSNKSSLLLKAYVLAELIKTKTTQKHIGIMLPAVQSTPLLLVATYLAQKIPVMLNWTVGNHALQQCVEKAELDCILTASSFYDKVSEKIAPETSKLFCFLDKEVPKMSTSIKLKGVFKKLIKAGKHHYKPDDTAVLLFTSGSETSPKPVPLSHKNILSDLNGVFSTIAIHRREVFLSILPPFHSFGFTVLNILPLVSDIQVAYSPDPTNADEVGRVIHHTKSSIVLGTPTFLRSIFNRATKEQLQSVKYIVSGAEAMREDVLSIIHSKTNKVTILEGYGITECSPVLTINPLEQQKENSVGVFIPQINWLIVDPENHTQKAKTNEGLLLVRGDNVFAGYADTSIASPFITVDNTSYYNTGDIVRVDDEGYVFITGRLKRFLKSGGEMLSLPYLESLLTVEFGNTEEASIAIEGVETPSGAFLCLFTTQNNMTVDKANSYIQSKSIGNLYRIKKCVTIEEIPQLGSGKVDYKQLRKMAEQEV